MNTQDYDGNIIAGNDLDENAFTGQGNHRLITARLFHYTRATNAMKILASGEIRPATPHVPKSERPVVWFSMHVLYEQTAFPGKRDGTWFENMEEMAVHETPSVLR